MQLALRPYVTTGVALAGAGALALSPIVVTPQLQLHPTPLASISADPQLTSIATDLAAAVNSIIDGFVGTAVEGVNLFDYALTNGTDFVQQGVTLGSTLLGGVVSYPVDAIGMIGDGLLTAMTDVFGVNPFTTAITSIVDGFIGPEGAAQIITAGLRDALDGGALVVNSLIGAGAGLLGAAVTIPANALGEVVTGFQNALDSFAAGDPAQAMADITAGLTAATAVITTGLQSVVNSGILVFNSLVTAGQALLNLAIQTPIAAGTAIVQGFINAFNGVVPTLASTPQQQSGPAPLSAASLTAGGSAGGSVSTNTTVTPKVTASLAPTAPSLASLPTITPPTLPSTSSTTAGSVSGELSSSTPSLSLGSAVSTAASAGKSKAGASADGSATAGSTGKRQAPHVSAGGSVKAKGGAAA